MIPNIPNCLPFTLSEPLAQIAALYEPGRRILWAFMHPVPRPCYTPGVLEDLARIGRSLQNPETPVDFLVVGSAVPGFYNTGGDLSLFVEKIKTRDRAGLLAYATACIHAVYGGITGFDTNTVTLALVEGAALGGGFEAALAHHFVLAQQDANLGFPEIAFNLFPGMGAYSLVTRKADRRLAEYLISTGNTHTADWHLERGLVDRVFVPGQGIAAIHTFVDELRPKLNGIRAMLRARQKVTPVTHAELMNITEDWVDSAMQLTDDELRYMERLVTLQNRRVRSLAAGA